MKRCIRGLIGKIPYNKEQFEIIGNYMDKRFVSERYFLLGLGFVIGLIVSSLIIWLT